MSKGLLSIFLAFTLILVTLPPPASAQQGSSAQQEQEKEKKKSKKRKAWDIFTHPEKAIDDAVDRLTGEKRSWSDRQKQDANTAQTLFRTPLGKAAESSTEPIYDPTNAANAQAMAAQVETVKAKYSKKQSLTPSEQQEIAGAVTPFLRYADAAGVTADDIKQPTRIKPAANGSLQIPAGSQLVAKLKTVCKDFNAPAPQAGERMHLVPSKDLIKEDFQPIYKALVEYSHNHQDEQSYAQIQRITWNLRHGCFKGNDNLRAMRLRPEDDALLDSLVPNASRTVKDKCKKFDFPKFKTDLLRAMLTGGGRLDINPVGLIDTNQETLRVVQAQTRMSVNEPIPDNNSDYSLLQEGVPVRSQHTKNSASETELIINNTTDQPVTFTPDEWSLESNRTVQRLGIVGIEDAVIIAIIGAVAVAAVLAAMFFSRGLFGGGLLAGLIGRFIRPGRGSRPNLGSTKLPTPKPTTPSTAKTPQQPKKSPEIPTNVPALSRSQQKAIDRINSNINDHLKESDIQGLIRDVSNNPVTKKSGGQFQHHKEVTEAVNGLKRSVQTLEGSLKNPKLEPTARAQIEQSVQRAKSYINRVDSIIRSH